MVWNAYRCTAITEMRPYVKGEDMDGIFIGEGIAPEEGGMIAREPGEPRVQWYIPPQYFQKNFVILPIGHPESTKWRLL